MRKVYPKIDEYLKGMESLDSYIRKAKGVEIQYFGVADTLADFEMENAVLEVYKKYPQIEEITLHPPLDNYDIEILLLKDKNLLLKQLKTAVELAKKLKITLNIIYHTHFTYEQHQLTTIKTMTEAVEILKGSKVHLLLENLYMMEEIQNCTVLEICQQIDSPNLKVCLDLCHIYCQAHIYKMGIEEYTSQYLDKEKCSKYVYQIHFSYTDKQDGYKDRSTHGICHKNQKDLNKDMKLLDSYGMQKARIVTEISEQDYKSRKDQITQLKRLSKYLEME